MPKQRSTTVQTQQFGRVTVWEFADDFLLAGLFVGFQCSNGVHQPLMVLNEGLGTPSAIFGIPLIPMVVLDLLQLDPQHGDPIEVVYKQTQQAGSTRQGIRVRAMAVQDRPEVTTIACSGRLTDFDTVLATAPLQTGIAVVGMREGDDPAELTAGALSTVERQSYPGGIPTQAVKELEDARRLDVLVP